MRSTWTSVGFLLSACLAFTPAYAAPRGAPTGQGKPTLTGKPTTAGKSVTPKSSSTQPTVKPTIRGNSSVKHSASASTTGSPRGVTTTHLNPIAAKISSKPQLASRLTQMLPPGMTLNQASRGFKNQGQFIAALHVSQNLGIPFRDLRRDMTVKHLSLGQSIQDLRPTAHATTETHRATTEADEDMRSALRPSKKASQTTAVHNDHDGDDR